MSSALPAIGTYRVLHSRRRADVYCALSWVCIITLLEVQLKFSVYASDSEIPICKWFRTLR